MIGMRLPAPNAFLGRLGGSRTRYGCLIRAPPQSNRLRVYGPRPENRTRRVSPYQSDVFVQLTRRGLLQAEKAGVEPAQAFSLDALAGR